MENAHESHKKTYIVIFIILALLTALEVYIPEIDASKMAKGSSLTLLAVGKAFLVAYYFMHLKEETKWLKFVAAIPITAVLYAVILVVETLVR
jgi:cytochrome c oxidase subunit IV